MNKNMYRGFYEVLEDFVFEQQTYELKKNKLVNSLMFIKELVDKETPMKPENTIYFLNRTYEACPVCGVSVYLDDHDYCLERCEYCGQKIDWSNEGE